MKISAAIITYNEENNIKDCLKSLDFVDEILIIDSFSNDKTVELCKKFGAKVYKHRWSGYKDQKNYALTKTKHDWVLSLDADEKLSKGLIKEILKIKDNGPGDYSGFMMPRRLFYFGKWLNHCSYPNYQLRLFDKNKGRWGEYNVHEKFITDAKTSYLKGDLLHYSYRSISDHVSRINRYTDLMSKNLFVNKQKFTLKGLLLSPIREFLEKYIQKKGFLDGIQGLIYSILSTYYRFLLKVKLWELYQLEKLRNNIR